MHSDCRFSAPGSIPGKVLIRTRGGVLRYVKYAVHISTPVYRTKIGALAKFPTVSPLGFRCDLTVVTEWSVIQQKVESS